MLCSFLERHYTIVSCVVYLIFMYFLLEGKIFAYKFLEKTKYDKVLALIGPTDQLFSIVARRWR